MRRTKGVRLLLVAALVASVGCGKKPAPTPVPVKGRVEFGKAKPKALLVLQLHPDEEKNAANNPSMAIQEDNTFQVTCLPGRYKATLTAMGFGGSDPAQGGGIGVGTVPDDAALQALLAFRNKDTSPLVVTVPEGGDENVVLKVE